MNRKIVVFTMSPRQSQFEVDRLVAEAGKKGIGVNRALYRELSFDIGRTQGSARTFVRGEELTAENTLGLWFRVAGTKSGKYTEARNLAIRILRRRNDGQARSARTNDIFCVNEKGYLGWTRMGKIAQHGVFLENNIPVVPTKIFYTREQILSEAWEYPVIAKHERGYQGKSVRKFENKKDMEDFVNKINEKNLGMFLWQKYLPTKWDIRVVIVDGRAIGAMKRSAVGEEFRSNFSLGGEVERWNLSEEERDLAEKVAKVCGLDYGGVDIMKGPKSLVLRQAQDTPFEERGLYREEDYDNYILEVNRQCQFQGFEKATGINVAKKIVEMIVKRA
ncbi:MAG TPA: ATP-grasp domain-containing protein [Candidatus Woesebacteria bacterium]|nr:ATP-grasp domain-containing protein [Candidatus Shapirobacteria bacterium]HOY61390.1 ATP-grasp domain-containing protein [Candidatus Woesebacteria bacterium]